MYYRDIPGKGIIWTNPNGAVTGVVASWFPRPGDMGHFFGKFSCMLLVGRAAPT